jgi:ethanolamine ammonia-lyase small subunit
MHAGGLLDALRRQVGHRYTVAPLVLAQQARVALGDQVAAAIGVETIVVVIGERPGLSVPHSLGAYITHNPRPDTTDAERNCVSNIHPPEGMGYDEAARSIVGVLDSARILGHTGVRGREGLPGGSPGRTALRPEPARAVATAGPRAERGVSR